MDSPNSQSGSRFHDWSVGLDSQILLQPRPSIAKTKIRSNSNHVQINPNPVWALCSTFSQAIMISLQCCFSFNHFGNHCVSRNSVIASIKQSICQSLAAINESKLQLSVRNCAREYHLNWSICIRFHSIKYTQTLTQNCWFASSTLFDNIRSQRLCNVFEFTSKKKSGQSQCVHNAIE